MKILKIYLRGILFLGIIIIINFLGGALNFTNWYEFLNGETLNLSSFLWLFIFYPTSLAVIAKIIFKNS